MEVLTILTVCTGNICRSPIAEQLLAQRFDSLAVHLESAGTRARDGMAMTPQAANLTTSLGVPERVPSAHRAHFLTDERLKSADLALAMAREHRRDIVELNPAFLRKTFTLRELHRLVGGVSDGALTSAADRAAEQNPAHRFAEILTFVASLRGTAPPPPSPDVDDVIDPFGRSLATYELSVAQIKEALPSVERIVRSAIV